MKPTLTLYRCPAHPNTWTLCVESVPSGIHVLGSKCCRQQYSRPQVSWELSESKVQEFSEALENALEDSET